MKQIKKIVEQLHKGSLGEAFLLTAIQSYSLQVVADDSDWGNSLVSKDAWQRIASEVLTMLDNEHTR